MSRWSLLPLLMVPQLASAFCGFYVAGAESSLYNDATMVVLMREGTRTVLSMQNTYQGPPEAFALVVPVPSVLQKEHVKTLPKEVFQHVDKLSAPRLVEYWEQDPCHVWDLEDATAMPVSSVRRSPGAKRDGGPDLGVKIEARFEVAEYDVVILSAKDSGGLDTWLRREGYNIPKGAEPVLRPYVQAGTKFFVAKVIPEKVTFEGDRAVLSPLRVQYDEEKFQLPVRLGLLNSKGEQDLIVHLLARGQRYEVANYDNAFIPTNLRVQDAVREDFGSFYDSVFRQVGKPGTVVTEYAWDASWCDPCPLPALTPSDLATLGADVIPGNPSGFVLTRLHYRYGPDGLKEDLVFRAAPPVIGGRGMPDASGELAEQSARPDGSNQFQGRYVILHRWEGEVACAQPQRGMWGGPPTGASPAVGAATSTLSGAVAKRVERPLEELLIDGFPGVKPRAPAAAPTPSPAPPAEGIPEMQGGRCETAPGAGGALGLGLALLLARRRR